MKIKKLPPEERVFALYFGKHNEKNSAKLRETIDTTFQRLRTQIDGGDRKGGGGGEKATYYH